MNAIQAGVEAGQFICDQPELLASQVTAQLQQWHLKQWKFKLRDIGTQAYAQFVFENLLKCLEYQGELNKIGAAEDASNAAAEHSAVA